MLKNNENVDDRSRNGSNAESFPKWKDLSFIENVERILIKPNLVNGYSPCQIRRFFELSDSSDFVVCNNEKERLQSNEFFKRIYNCLDFNCNLQANVMELFVQEFTLNQLACIDQVYKHYIRCGRGDDLYPKWLLFDYIDNEGKNLYDLGDKEVLKARIQSINQIEYEVFVNFIIEVFEMEEYDKAVILKHLVSDGHVNREIREKREQDFINKHLNEIKEVWEANKHKEGSIQITVKPDYTPSDTGFQFIEEQTEKYSYRLLGISRSNSYILVDFLWLATITHLSLAIPYEITYPEIEN
ncbi:MAG: hypothetical protein ACOXZO_04785 [Bacteroidales bacterium]|jgi:hypothetical protein